MPPKHPPPPTSSNPYLLFPSNPPPPQTHSFPSFFILSLAHSNYLFFILFSIEITHSLVRGTHSLMRRVTSVTADAGAPVTYNPGGRKCCARGNGEGPVTAKSQGTWNAVRERGNGHWQPDISMLLYYHVNLLTLLH